MKYIKFKTVMLALVAILNACTVSQDLETPPQELPEGFRNDAGIDSLGIGELPWKFFHTDPFLRTLIDSGLVHNADMMVALNNLEASNLQLQQARWGNIPEVGFQLQASIARPSDNSLNGLNLKPLGQKHIESYTSAFSISWEADIWGKIRNEKRAALAAYLQTKEARRGIQTRLVAAIAEGYYNLLILDHQVNIAERNLKLRDTTLRLFQLQYDAGEIAIVGVQEAEAQRLTAAEIIAQLHQARSLQENVLSLLLGRLPDTIHRSGSLPTTTLSRNLAAGLPVAMVSRRPDVKSRELALIVANAQVGIAKAQMYPSLRITAIGGEEAFRFSNWFNIPASLFGVAAGSVLQPVLQQRRLKTQHKIAQIERVTAVIRFRQSVLIAVREVSDALVEIKQSELRAGIAEERLKALQGAVHNAQLLFQNGQATYLEVLTAQSSLLQSELELANTKREQLAAAVELYRSLGGGWK